MSKTLTHEELERFIDKSTNKLNAFIKKLAEDENNKSNNKRAMLLAYWIIDYIKMLTTEKTFDSSKLLKYNRGDIVLVDFGYRIGNEFGGKHFAVVIDKYNSKKSGIICVAPLTSKKEKTYNPLYCHELKTGLHELHQQKLDSLIEYCREKARNIEADNQRYLENPQENSIDDINSRLKSLNKKIDEGYELKNQIDKLKDGSIVNVGQIITISKIRIINPKQSSDSLKGIKICSEDLNSINEKIKNLFIYENKNETLSAFINGLNFKS